MGDAIPGVEVEAGVQASALEFLSAHDHSAALPGDFENEGSDPYAIGDHDDFTIGEHHREVETGSVRGNWLDAFQREHMEDFTVESGYVTAVNSDEAGLYRLFHNLSP